jgi:hypothetical protein
LNPFDLAFDRAGNLFVTAWGSGSGGHIYKFTPAGVRSTFAELGAPEGLAFDSAGNLFVVDEDTGNIFKFTPNGVRSTFAAAVGLSLDEVAFLAFQPPNSGLVQPPNTPFTAAADDFNKDGKPDFVLYNASTDQTAVWYMNNNVRVGGGSGPTLPPGCNWWGLRILTAMAIQIICSSTLRLARQ